MPIITRCILQDRRLSGEWRTIRGYSSEARALDALAAASDNAPGGTFRVITGDAHDRPERVVGIRTPHVDADDTEPAIYDSITVDLAGVPTYMVGIKVAAALYEAGAVEGLVSRYLDDTRELGVMEAARLYVNITGI